MGYILRKFVIYISLVFQVVKVLASKMEVPDGLHKGFGFSVFNRITNTRVQNENRQYYCLLSIH